MIKRLFLQHPQSEGETYFQHAKIAFAFSWGSLKMAMTSFIHGVFPFIFTLKSKEQFQELQRLIDERSLRKK